jgi:hypothetical protein
MTPESLPDEARTAWQQFRAAVEKTAKRTLENLPLEAKDDNLILCYLNLSDFVRSFPTPQERIEIVSRMQRCRMYNRIALTTSVFDSPYLYQIRNVPKEPSRQ